MPTEDFSWVKAIVIEYDVEAEQNYDGSWSGGVGSKKSAFESIDAAIDYADESNADSVQILDIDGNEIDPEKYYEEKHGN